MSVPAVPLEPVAMLEWALMQMVRGRRAPMFPLPRTSSVPEPRSADYARMARRCATCCGCRPPCGYLAASAFTLPVARPIQEARFEGAPDPSLLGEALLSGLVYARAPATATADSNAATITSPRGARDPAALAPRRRRRS